MARSKRIGINVQDEEVDQLVQIILDGYTDPKELAYDILIDRANAKLQSMYEANEILGALRTQLRVVKNMCLRLGVALVSSIGPNLPRDVLEQRLREVLLKSNRIVEKIYAVV